VAERYRRSPYLVTYWERRRLVVENYATRTRVAASPLAIEVLDLFDRWRGVGVVAREFSSVDATTLARAVAALVRLQLLERSSDPPTARATALTTWKDWSPAASFFHLTTKDTHAPVHRELPRGLTRARRSRRRPPVAVKSYPRRAQIELPNVNAAGELPHVLKSRRTWREFSGRPLTMDQLATLLGLTFGVQAWRDVPGVGRVPMKTSPSGGARHPIEAYVVAPRVVGLGRGLYHYNAASHRLERLRSGATSRQVTTYLNGQEWFGRAGAVVVMTAVFARTQWKYPASRAYRAVLLDAGHLGQTFCLVATWLGLAPFCTMALADSRIERDLGIDGVTESVLYAAGVGVRPAGAL
jgi:SagB-type dehydrogenase family enzyme